MDGSLASCLLAEQTTKCNFEDFPKQGFNDRIHGHGLRNTLANYSQKNIFHDFPVCNNKQLKRTLHVFCPPGPRNHLAPAGNTSRNVPPLNLVAESHRSHESQSSFSHTNMSDDEMNIDEGEFSDIRF